MTNAIRAWAVAVGLLAGACGGPAASFDVELADDPAAVSDAASDPLFSLAVIDSPDTYAPLDVEVWLEAAGASTYVVTWTHDDADGDGLVGPGDALVVAEPPGNVVGAADAGTTYRVQVVESLGESRVATLWEGTWTAE